MPLFRLKCMPNRWCRDSGKKRYHACVVRGLFHYGMANGHEAVFLTKFYGFYTCIGLKSVDTHTLLTLKQQKKEQFSAKRWSYSVILLKNKRVAEGWEVDVVSGNWIGNTCEVTFTTQQGFTAFSSIYKLIFDVYHEARQSSQLLSPDRLRCFW